MDGMGNMIQSSCEVNTDFSEKSWELYLQITLRIFAERYLQFKENLKDPSPPMFIVS